MSETSEQKPLKDDTSMQTGSDGDEEVFEPSKSSRPSPAATKKSAHFSGQDSYSSGRHHDRHNPHRSSRRSHHSDKGSPVMTKTDLIRASAKKAEEKRKHSSEHGSEHTKKIQNKSPSLGSRNSSPKKIKSMQSSGSQRESIAVIEVRRTSGSNRKDSSSSKQSLSTSPKHAHKPVSTSSSKTSLLGKQTSITGSSFRNYSGLIQAIESVNGLQSQTLLTRGSSRTHGYSKPAMEVAVAALVFAAGVVTLIISLIIGSSAWIIVGAISMGIGGVFIAFGACFYIARHKPLNSDDVEIRIVDKKQLAELSNDSYNVRAVVDL